MRIQQLVRWGKAFSKKLLMVDASGALLSAFLLGVVLVKLESFFGVPRTTLNLLASIPCLFAVYDFYCVFKVEANIGVFIQGIAIMNIMYCCLSIGVLMYHRTSISYLAWIYFLTEIVLVRLLAFVELRVAKNHTSQ